MREKKAYIFLSSESPARSSANPHPPKIMMYGPVICWVKKTSIEFHIYSKLTEIKPFKKALKLNMEPNNNLGSIKRTQRKVTGDNDVMEEA